MAAMVHGRIVWSSCACKRPQSPAMRRWQRNIRVFFGRVSTSGADMQCSRGLGRHCCRTRAASVDTDASIVSDPFADKVVYHDDTFSRVLIRFITMKISDEVGTKPKKDGYDGFVEMSEAIMRGRTPEQQRETVLLVLNSVLPAIIPWAARNFFRPTELTCFLCAFFAHAGFAWLVGDMELQEEEVQLPDGSTQVQLSTVYIKKCRYLEQSGCVGMCVNMCKVPTQTFFTESFGMPLYMEPNFEDLSCKMIFGQMPPALGDDPVSTQPCFSSCAIGMVNDSNCKKLPNRQIQSNVENETNESVEQLNSSADVT